MQFGDADRLVVEAEPADWQLLDGQQRINALYSIFTAAGQYGRFYLHMGEERPPARGPVTRRRARDDGLGYIHWIDSSEADSPVPDRSLRIDLSRWYEWAEGDGRRRIEHAAAISEDDPGALLSVLMEIDPEFTDDPLDLDPEVASTRLAALISLWREPVIPVEYCILGSPLDVLEVFTRVNRAGLQVAGQDLFFAAVKTLWRDAELAVARTTEVLTPRHDALKWDALVDRMTALRVLARLAAHALLGTDLTPLAIDRLTGERGKQLISAMEQLSQPESVALRRMSVLMGSIAEHSALGFGLYAVDQRLWDVVLAWAAVDPRGEDRVWIELNLPAIDAFLVGATSFRWASVLRDRFARLAMGEALISGALGEGFPVDRIPAVVRGANALLQEGRERVHSLETIDDKLHWADANPSLLLAIVQAIPFRPQRDLFDWDHIFPQAKASLMWVPGPDGRWRRHHRYRRFVGGAGNFWGLDAGTNRAMHDELPAAKFEQIRALKDAGQRPIWPEDRWWLTNGEIDAFSVVGAQLVSGDIEPAMELFHETVVNRTLRLVDEVLRRMPVVSAFAGGTEIVSADPRPIPSIAGPLGLPKPEEPLSRSPLQEMDSRVERILARADELGTGDAIRAFVARLRTLGLHVRGYKYTITITPPTTRTVALVSIAPSDNPAGVATVWVAPDAFAKQFPKVPWDLFTAKLSGIRRSQMAPSEIGSLAGTIEEALWRADPRGESSPIEPSMVGVARGSDPSEWSWDSYARVLRVPTDRIAIGRRLVADLEAVVAEHALPWQTKFRKGYVAIQRRGGRNVAVVDVWWHGAPRLGLKLPDSPDRLGLRNPYPDLPARWGADEREWEWSFISPETYPDVSVGIDLVLPFQPGTSADDRVS